MLNKDDVLDNLTLPSMRPLSLLRHFGPGMILMMTGIGTSHLVTAPVAGGRFEYALLWCVLVSYVFKYYGFEMAFRFTNATGKEHDRSVQQRLGRSGRSGTSWSRR